MKVCMRLLQLSLLSVTLLLSGCFSPVKVDNMQVYTLNPQIKAIKRSHSSKTILVLSPEPSAALDYDKMVYVTKAHEFGRYEYNRWAATPSQLIQPLIVQSLQATGHYKAVMSAPFLGETNYRLYTQLITLQQNFIFDPSREQIVLAAQITDGQGNIIASHQFSAWAKAPMATPYGGVIAANDALSKILSQLTQFVLRYS